MTLGLYGLLILPVHPLHDKVTVKVADFAAFLKFVFSINLPFKQCSGSMTFWCGSGSGSADPCLWLFGSGSGSSTFKMPAKKLFLNTIFSACYFLKVHLHYFSKIKSQKESQNSRTQGFSYYFCMMIEGSGSGSRAGSGSIPLTSGSGSGRPKNTWIRWIRNNAFERKFLYLFEFLFWYSHAATKKTLLLSHPIIEL
jgi:hypothetical protein